MPTLDTDQVGKANIEHAIERQILQRTWGRVHRLHVKLLGDRLVVQGRTATYYTKQLALEAALELLGETDARSVDLDIQVGSPPSPIYRNPSLAWSTMQSLYG